jgi:hypothetical protein
MQSVRPAIHRTMREWTRMNRAVASPPVVSDPRRRPSKGISERPKQSAGDVRRSRRHPHEFVPVSISSNYWEGNADGDSHYGLSGVHHEDPCPGRFHGRSLHREVRFPAPKGTPSSWAGVPSAGADRWKNCGLDPRDGRPSLGVSKKIKHEQSGRHGTRTFRSR